MPEKRPILDKEYSAPSPEDQVRWNQVKAELNKAIERVTKEDGLDKAQAYIAEELSKGRTFEQIARTQGTSAQYIEILSEGRHRRQEIIERWMAGEKTTDLAREYGISNRAIHYICDRVIERLRKNIANPSLNEETSALREWRDENYRVGTLNNKPAAPVPPLSAPEPEANKAGGILAAEEPPPERISGPKGPIITALATAGVATAISLAMGRNAQAAVQDGIKQIPGSGIPQEIKAKRYTEAEYQAIEATGIGMIGTQPVRLINDAVKAATGSGADLDPSLLTRLGIAAYQVSKAGLNYVGHLINNGTELKMDAPHEVKVDPIPLSPNSAAAKKMI